MNNEKPTAGQQFELHVPRRSTKLECNSSVNCHNPRISLRFNVPCLIEQDSFGFDPQKITRYINIKNYVIVIIAIYFKNI